MSSILIVGSGAMAIEYARVLNALERPPVVIGRSEERSKAFEEAIPNTRVLRGGLEAHRKSLARFDAAIVAVNINELSPLTHLLLEEGVRNILVEKPGALSLDAIHALQDLARQRSARILIAYNRRFYHSTELAREIIRQDGGATSFVFDFTEWSHLIDISKYSRESLEHWVLSNSSHVIDLAFHLCGRPKDFHCAQHASSIPWHPSGSIFTGHGISELSIPFAYHADWGAPGRWSVEVLTRKHRLFFKPMERLSLQKLGEVKIVQVESNYAFDIDFKPGFYKQVKAFLDYSDDDKVCTLEEHALNFPVYQKIAGYDFTS